MAIKRYVADADNTITNAFNASLQNSNRATGSNMGLADILEVFSIYGQVSGSSGSSFPGESQELSRVLIKFPITKVSQDRTAGKIPASGSVSWYLRMFNAKHGQTLPRDYSMTIQAVSRSWQEGLGLDMDNYTDKTYGGVGSCWVTASEGVPWTTVGGDYHASPTFSASFGEKGTKNIDVNISDVVEQWIAGTKSNYGVGVRLSSSYEAYYSSSTGQNTGSVLDNTGGAKRSYYTKKFFARESEFFFKRPILEARWNDSREDNRADFYYSSSLAPAADNLNTLYLYNYVRGKLVNIPAVGTGKLSVSLYSGSAKDTGPSGSKLELAAGGGVVTALDTNVTGGYVSTGIYSASFAITASAGTPIKTLYDVWHSGGVEFNTGSIIPKTMDALEYNDGSTYVVNIKNMKDSYSTDETARFRLFVREKNWNPTMYTKAVATQQTLTLPSASYKVVRVADNYEVIEFGTGSTMHNCTQLSYDVSGNYFNLDMSMLQPGYMYGIKLAFYNDAVSGYQQQKPIFKFRVEDDNE
jgi:hypothetical protein